MSEELVEYKVNTNNKHNKQVIHSIKGAIKESTKEEVISVLIEVHSGNIELLDTWGIENGWWSDSQAEAILNWLTSIEKKELFELYNQL